MWTPWLGVCAGQVPIKAKLAAKLAAGLASPSVLMPPPPPRPPPAAVAVAPRVSARKQAESTHDYCPRCRRGDAIDTIDGAYVCTECGLWLATAFDPRSARVFEEDDDVVRADRIHSEAPVTTSRFVYHGTKSLTARRRPGHSKNGQALLQPWRLQLIQKLSGGGDTVKAEVDDWDGWTSTESPTVAIKRTREDGGGGSEDNETAQPIVSLPSLTPLLSSSSSSAVTAVVSATATSAAATTEWTMVEDTLLSTRIAGGRGSCKLQRLHNQADIGGALSIDMYHVTVITKRVETDIKDLIDHLYIGSHAGLHERAMELAGMYLAIRTTSSYPLARSHRALAIACVVRACAEQRIGVSRHEVAMALLAPSAARGATAWSTELRNTLGLTPIHPADSAHGFMQRFASLVGVHPDETRICLALASFTRFILRLAQCIPAPGLGGQPYASAAAAGARWASAVFTGTKRHVKATAKERVNSLGRLVVSKVKRNSIRRYDWVLQLDQTYQGMIAICGVDIEGNWDREFDAWSARLGSAAAQRALEESRSKASTAAAAETGQPPLSISAATTWALSRSSSKTIGAALVYLATRDRITSKVLKAKAGPGSGSSSSSSRQRRRPLAAFGLGHLCHRAVCSQVPIKNACHYLRDYYYCFM